MEPKQIILIKGASKDEFEQIRLQLEKDLASGLHHFTIPHSSRLIEVEVLDIPGQAETTQVINNCCCQLNEAEFERRVLAVLKKATQ